MENEHNHIAQETQGHAQVEKQLSFQANALAQVSDAVIGTDNENRIAYWNAAAEKLYGLSAAEAIGIPLQDAYQFRWLSPADEQAALSSFRTDGFWHGENIHQKRNGEEICVDISTTALKDEHGKKIGMLAVTRDVTVRKQAETELRKAHSELETQVAQQTKDLQFALEDVRESRTQVLDVLESISDGFFALDSLWRFTYINTKAQQLLGMRKEEVLFKKIWDKLPNAQILRLYKELISASEQKTATVFEELIVPLDRWFEFHVYPYENGLTVYFSDITVKKEAEKEREHLLEQLVKEQEQVKGLASALKTERDILEAVTESTRAQTIYLDPEFNFVLVNSAYEKGSGHAKEELLGKNHFDIFPNEDNETIFKQVRDAGKAVEYKAKPFEYADQPWRGVTYWDWTLTPIKDKTGIVVGLVLSLVDVTESIRSKLLSDTLNSSMKDIHSSLNVAETMDKVVCDATRAIGVESAAILERENDYWIVRYAYGFADNIIDLKVTDEQSPQAAIVAETKEPLIVDDAYSDKRMNQEFIRQYSFRSFLTIPLFIRRDIFGVLYFNYHSAPVAFSDAQVDFAKKLASSISLALENARLYEEAVEARQQAEC
ncbi:MAG TPA: PAS domain S-box protein [Candidatus Aquicultor sp.]|jgi:PAS domain S-box-containing protein